MILNYRKSDYLLRLGIFFVFADGTKYVTILLCGREESVEQSDALDLNICK